MAAKTLAGSRASASTRTDLGTPWGGHTASAGSPQRRAAALLAEAAAPDRRVMVLAHTRYGCRYLGADDRCTIYTARPLGCRVFPFDPTFGKDGKLRRLKLIPAAECEYELDGDNDPERIRKLQTRLDRSTDAYHRRIAKWNRLQAQRRRDGQPAETSARFLAYLGF